MGLKHNLNVQSMTAPTGERELERVVGFLLNADFRRDSDVGWTCNCLWERDVPYVWRNNGRCNDDRFWSAFECMVHDTGLRCDMLLHDNFAGWCRCRKVKPGRFIRVAANADAIAFLRRYACWGRRWSRPGAMNDNYYAVDLNRSVLMAFTHEGDFVCFSRDIGLLRAVSASFRRKRLVSAFGGGCELRFSATAAQ